ncbi:hypothetical protein XF24_00089 [candidate division SR1 bacterium Aalborg_AAW-1]|nr:hypothetical protein XF24_00089 [candidate division SR1 bacterium Aalborg_AAW-1]
MNISTSTFINGTYSSVNNQKGLIVFVHGLTSSKDEPILSQGELYFNSKGYSTFRFNLYDELGNERKLSNVSLSDHIQDINDVIDYFLKKGETNIILIGHSFGGLSLLYSDLKHVSKLVLWDSSIGGEELLGDVYEDDQGKYIDRGDQYKRYISDTLYEDFCIDPIDNIQQLKSLKLPIIIIAAEEGLQDPALLYAESIHQKAFIIAGADHIFSDDNHKKELFDITMKNL